MSWSNDMVLDFLQLYKKEQLLWDPKHPLHRNRSEVTDAWVRIQLSLGVHNCSIVDLKKKKESLMTSFRMHFNKKKKCPEAYHTTWFAYPLMESFLSGKYECDSTNQMENEFFNTSYNTQQPTLDHVSRPATVKEPTPGRQYRTSPNPSIANPKPASDETTSYAKTPPEKREVDEYDLYGQLLAKKLRKLDEHQRDMVMHEIDNLMFRAKMQSSSQSRSYSKSPSPGQRKVKSPIFIVAPQPSHTQYEDENISYQEHMQPAAPE